MANTHLQPSMMAESQSMFGDLLAPTILASTLTTPGGGLTLPAFSTQGYVLNGSPKRLVYVNQPAAAVTLAGGDGAYWLALMHDTHSAIAAWARQPGTHYAWLAAGTQPPDPAGGLVMAGVMVVGGSISAVDPSPNYPAGKVAYGGWDGALAFDSELTYDPTANVLTTRGVQIPQHTGDNRVGFFSALTIAGGTNRWHFYGAGDAPSWMGGALTVQGHLAGNTLNMNGAATLGSTLQVGGASTLTGAVGIGGAPSAEALTVHGTATIASTLYAGGIISTPSGLIVSGLAQVQTLRVNDYTGLGGAPDNRFSLRAYGTTYHDGYVGIAVVPTCHLDVNGYAYVRQVVGIGTPPNGSWSLITLGGIYAGSTLYGAAGVDVSSLNVRGGANYIAGYTGIGRVAAAPWSLCLVSLYADAQIQTNELHARAGVGIRADPGAFALYSPSTAQSYLGGVVGIGLAPNPGYWLNLPTLHCESITWDNISYGGSLQMGGNLNSANVIVSGNLYGVTAVMTGELQGASIVISSGQAYKIGGGPWIDSSSRAMKRHITPIPDALGLLLEQRGRVYEWDEPRHAEVLPGPRYGLVYDEVTIEQWRTTTPAGEEALAIQGAEALFIEAFRQIVNRLDALEAR